MLNSISLCVVRRCSFFFLPSPPSRPPTHPSSVYVSAGLFVIPLVSPDRILCPSTIRAEPLTSGPLSPSPYLPTNACRSPLVHFSLFAFARCQTGSRVVVLQGHVFKWLWSEKVAEHLAATFSINWNHLKFELCIFFVFFILHVVMSSKCTEGRLIWVFQAAPADRLTQ